jgi:multidrug transporter EmrE-like cation transporter
MAISSATAAWLGLLLSSALCDVVATAFLKVASDRIHGAGFLWAAILGVAIFGPSIIMFGYAMRIGPSYLATAGIWAVGVYALNAVVGVMVFGDPFGWRIAAGMATACATVALLMPTQRCVSST